MLFYFCMRGCGRIARPAFPAPSYQWAARFRHSSRNTCGEIANPYFTVIASKAKQSIGQQRKCGLLRRFASRNDGLRTRIGGLGASARERILTSRPPPPPPRRGRPPPPNGGG